MSKKVSLFEEVSPEEGFTDAEIKAGIWNSPPATKGQGRYLVEGKTIEPSDFAALKAAGKIFYWSRDFLEDCDEFTTSEGWRIHADGVLALKARGYEIAINTIEARGKAKVERMAKAKIEDALKITKENLSKEKYAKEIADYEAWLGNPKWDGKNTSVAGRGVSLRRILHDGAENYTEYFLNHDGQMEVFWYYNSDFWNSGYSNILAPAHIVEEAQRIKAQQATEEQNRKSAWEEEKKHRPYVHYSCPRCNRQVYVSKAQADRNKAVRCGKCHTGKKATEASTVEYTNVGMVEFQNIPVGAEII